MKTFLSTCLSFTLLVLFSRCDNPVPASPEATARFESVIPRPVYADIGVNSFMLDQNTEIVIADAGSEIGPVANYLTEKIRAATGIALKRSAGDAPRSGSIYLALKQDAALGAEGY